MKTKEVSTAFGTNIIFLKWQEYHVEITYIYKRCVICRSRRAVFCFIVCKDYNIYIRKWNLAKSWSENYVCTVVVASFTEQCYRVSDDYGKRPRFLEDMEDMANGCFVRLWKHHEIWFLQVMTGSMARTCGIVSIMDKPWEIGEKSWNDHGIWWYTVLNKTQDFRNGCPRANKCIAHYHSELHNIVRNQAKKINTKQATKMSGIF